MSELMVLVLAGTACCLFSLRRPAVRPPPRSRATWAGGGGRNRRPSAEAVPRLVRQVAALLAAGRTGPILWDAMAHVLAVEQHRAQQLPELRPARQPYRNGRPQPKPPAGFGEENQTQVHVDGTLLLILAVQRASVLGLPTATAIRNACGTAAVAGRGRKTGHRRGALTAEQLRMWLDVAACFEVCEASGAPVAAVLERLANTMEADHDAAAMRETALAGPRATVRLLSWLPFMGLGLGALMGVDPLAALLGSPVGWAVTAAGTGFAVAGRIWSATMIADAARPVQPSNRQRPRAYGLLRAARSQGTG